ncbi:MAG: DUF1761 domain-containing protein [Flavobacteriales bacterium]|nr:DUF1761 domain-containing protein [Flavobacteriales bacterium]MCB0758050.1 DUF1761 domain-containing protein [Flavobacteriales bacterium]
MDIGQLPYLHILVAALAAFALGAIWYSFLFGKTWMKELGFTEESIRSSGANMGMIFGSTLVLTFIMAFGIAVLIELHQVPNITWMDGLRIGLLAGLFFVATSMAINYLYQRRSIKLWLIDAGYQVCFMGLIGAILGAWH